MLKLARIFRATRFIFLVCVVVCSISVASAQPTAVKSMVDTWLVTVAGEDATRTLIVASEAQSESGALLSARYGFTSKGKTPIEAKMTNTGGRRQLNLITQADTVITATEQEDGSFSGTFTLKSGVVKTVTVVRTAVADVQPPPQNKSGTLIQPPASDVPPACAALSGGWGGEWPSAGFASLWVVSVSQNCFAQVIYKAGIKQPSLNAKTTEALISGSSLSVKRPDGGTSSFTLKGSGLAAKYVGPSGNNEVQMTRLSLDSTEQSRLEAEIAASRAMIPVGPEVPTECAVFQGNWFGQWAMSQGEFYLRVVEVKVLPGNSKCNLRFSYSDNKNPGPANETADAQGGRLSFVCNKVTGGICNFDMRNGSLEVSYANKMGGSNSATFRKIQ